MSEALVAEMARLAKQFKVKFILANIEGDHAMLDFAEKNRIPHIDISVDLNWKRRLRDLCPYRLAGALIIHGKIHCDPPTLLHVNEIQPDRRIDSWFTCRKLVCPGVQLCV